MYPGEVRSTAISVSVCESVCPIAYVKNHTAKLHEICACYAWPWLGPALITVQYIMYFRFCWWCHVFTQWTKYRHTELFTATSAFRKQTGSGTYV